LRGVWLADERLDENEGAEGDAVLILEIPVSVIREFELIEDGKPYREFIVPAQIVIQFPIAKIEEDPLWERDQVRRARGLPPRK
jgi:hypothetical protein